MWGTVTSLTADPLTQLAFALHENKGVFALLLGSGLSRAAGIPTGWEITLDLIRRVATAQGAADQPDWAKWYRESEGQEPNYSTLLKALASSSEERRAILHAYIEPSAADREEGRKLPTRAHYAIADLVQAGYVRVVVTTNFDRLLENALRERGIEPTVIGSVDALAGAQPITHSACYVLKLHGDYMDARVLNTDEELTAYPKKYNTLLDRIFDEHGLIVCGWSGEWDHALRAAFNRAPTRRYPVYWSARGVPSVRAGELITQRAARVVEIADADGFFVTLRERVETLAQTRQQNPVGVDLLVNTAKRYLGKPEHRIQIDELFATETERLISTLDGDEFSPQRPWDPSVFRARVAQYEAATEALARMAGVLGRWGDDTELALVLAIVQSLYAQAEKVGAGVTYCLNIRSYPAVLVFKAYGLGLTRGGRWALLHKLFTAEIAREYKEAHRTVDLLFLWGWKGTEGDVWKLIEGLDRRRTPFSDHLLDVFSGWGKSFVGVLADFVMMYERFEVLGSLAHLERNPKADIQAGLTAETQRPGAWMPVGRAGWDERNSKRLLSEIQAEPLKSALLKAGFAQGDPQFLALFIANFQRFAHRMRW